MLPVRVGPARARHRLARRPVGGPARAPTSSELARFIAPLDRARLRALQERLLHGRHPGAPGRPRPGAVAVPAHARRGHASRSTEHAARRDAAGSPVRRARDSRRVTAESYRHIVTLAGGRRTCGRRWGDRLTAATRPRARRAALVAMQAPLTGPRCRVTYRRLAGVTSACAARERAMILEGHHRARAGPHRHRGGRLARACPSLKKRGRRFLGLCPFHKEKTPSFNVNPDSGVYHCFGCKESGRRLHVPAARRGLHLPRGRAGAGRARRHRHRGGARRGAERGRAAQEGARGALRRDEHGRRLLRGAAPHAPAAAVRRRRARAPRPRARQRRRCRRSASATRRRGGTAWRVPQEAGRLARGGRERRPPRAAVERHRVLRPLPPSAHVRGHRHARARRGLQRSGAGAIPGDEADAHRDPPPKYINSPESPIYTKGANLFGLWQARHAIRQKEHAILVEGNFDVVSLHARGVENVVAPLGTAFTEDQAKLLRRYATTLTLLFDGDAAGRKAARAAEQPVRRRGARREGRDPAGQDGPGRSRAHQGRRGAPAHRSSRRAGSSSTSSTSSSTSRSTRRTSARRRRASSGWRGSLARQKDPVVRGMAEAYADQAASRLDLVRSAPDAFGVAQAADPRRRPAPRASTSARVPPRPASSRAPRAARSARPSPGPSSISPHFSTIPRSRPSSRSWRPTRHGLWQRWPAHAA